MHTPSWELNAYLDQALQQGELQQLEQHINECPECRDQLAQESHLRQRTQDALTWLEEIPVSIPAKELQLQKLHARLKQRSPATAPKSSHSQTPPKKSWSQWLLWPMGWASAVAALALIWWSNVPSHPPGHPHQNTPYNHSKDTPKGPIAPPHFEMLVGETSPTSSTSPQLRKVRVVENGAPLAPGQLIQFRVRMFHSMHAMIVGLNQHGQLFSYVPFQGHQSIPLAKGAHHLPRGSSLELDDTLGVERFFIVTSLRPFSLSELKPILLRAWQAQQRSLKTPLELPSGWVVNSLWMQKHSAQPLPPRRRMP